MMDNFNVKVYFTVGTSSNNFVNYRLHNKTLLEFCPYYDPVSLVEGRLLTLILSKGKNTTPKLVKTLSQDVFFKKTHTNNK